MNLIKHLIKKFKKIFNFFSYLILHNISRDVPSPLKGFSSPVLIVLLIEILDKNLVTSND